jgi:hypothetical protein
MIRFENLQTPPDDGGILLEPVPERWPSLVEHNVRLRERCNALLAGTPVRQTSEQTRSQLLGITKDTSIVAAGHQPAFIHAGVWAKHVVVRAFTRSAGMAGVDFVVDNDAPHSSVLQVPAPAEDGLLAVREIAFTTAGAGSAYEGRAPVSRDRLQSIRGELVGAMGRSFDESPMTIYLDGLAGFTGAGDAVDQHLAGRLRIDTTLDADLPEYRVSEVVGGPFVADLLLNADRFAAAYNQSLAEYRREQGIHSPDRPLPNLGRSGERVETALWVYQPLQRRRRLWVESRGDRIRCYADEIAVGELGRDELVRDDAGVVAGLGPWVIRPRALTLTLWARLLACDLFVHGIGGAKYDRITDGIFRRYYACEPPAYVCVSATLRLPWPTFPSMPEDLAVARYQIRDWRFNPHRYCRDLPADVLAEREELIRRSEKLRQARGRRPERREVFTAIRALNAGLVESRPEVARNLAQRRDLLARQVESNRVAAGREYFYALSPRGSLQRLAERLRGALRLP